MDNIYICYASSDLFAQPTGVSLISLFENNRDLSIQRVFLLDYGLTAYSKDKFSLISEQYSIPIEFVRSKEIIEKKRDELGLVNFEGSMATYSRAFIDLIIPEYVDNLIYIDSDTVVAESIMDLATMEMGDAVMSAIVGINQYTYSNEPINQETTLLTGNKHYFACGVIRYSLRNWRKNKCLQLICDTCHRMDKFQFADQTLINNSIPEKWIIPMHPRFNSWLHEVPVCFEDRELSRGNLLSKDEKKEAIAHPTIIHYKGAYYRPWFKESISRANHLYQKYKLLSPWSEVPLTSIPGLLSKDPLIREKVELDIRTLAPRQKIKHLWILSIYDVVTKAYRKYYRKYLNRKYR